MTVFDSAIDSSKVRYLSLEKRGSLNYGFGISQAVKQVHVVNAVMQGGKAEKAGLRKWDKLVKINSTSLEGLDQPAVIKLLMEAGDSEIELLVQSPSSITALEGSGKEISAHYELDAPHTIKVSKSIFGESFGFSFQPHFSPVHVVSAVTAGGVAARVGLQVGERILEINGKDVTSTTWTAVIKLIQTGEEVLLKLAPSGSLFRRPLV